MLPQQENRATNVSFFQRNPINCPICDAPIYREELLTGRGRLIAGNLSLELRRLYEESKKYGEVSPLIYTITVCPDCYYASMKEHFLKAPPSTLKKIDDDRHLRIDAVTEILGSLNFNHERGLLEGLASYYLAIRCYDYFPKDFAPVIHQGISALRAAWLADDVERHEKGNNFAYLSRIFYRKARYFYSLALEYEQKGVQTITNCANLGPDLDKNYGYDGVVYLNGYLEYHFGPRKNEERRKEMLTKSKRSVARIFGMGKANKNRPLPLLENARELYNMIAKTLGQKNAIPEEDARSEED